MLFIQFLKNPSGPQNESETNLDNPNESYLIVNQC